MKIAVLGAGNVGETLGKRFANIGHDVFFGVPNPMDYTKKGLPGKIGTVQQSSSESEIILLAVPYNAVESVLKSCGNLDGKIVIDATNPLGMTPNGLNLTLGFGTSGGEKLQEIVPQAKVVKCFNTTGFGNMANPNNSMMFACGNDKEATDKIVNLASSIGFDAMNIGDLSKARLLEPLAMLWIHLSFTSELKRDFAFAIKRN